MNSNRATTSLVPRLAALALLLLAGYAAYRIIGCRTFSTDPVKGWDAAYFVLTGRTAFRAALFGLLLAAGAILCVKVLRNELLILLAPLAMLVGAGQAGALAALLLQSAAGLAVGMPLYRRIRGADASPYDTSPTGLMVSWFLGGSINAYLAWIALHWRINCDYVYFSFLLAEIVLLRRPLAAALSAAAKKAKSHRFSAGQWVVLFFAVFFLPCCLVPLYFYDDVIRHLFIPKQVALFGRHAFDPSYIWAIDTELFAQSYYTISYLLGGEYAVRLSSHAAIVVAMLLVEDYCRRTFGRRTALGAVTAMASTPLLGCVVGGVYLEALNLLSVAMAVIVVLDRFGRIDRGTVNTFFVLAPIAYLFKQQAVFLTVPLTVLLAGELLIRCRREGSFRPMIWLVAGGLLAIVIVLPFFGQNYILTGNPVFPWLNGIFRSEWWKPVNWEGVRFYDRFSLWSLADLTFRGELFGEKGQFQFGVAYFVLLWFMPLVFVNKRRRGVKWALAGLFLASLLLWWVITSPNIRYFVGPMVPGSILLGLTVNELWKLIRGDRLAAALTVAALATALGVNLVSQLSVTEVWRAYPLVEAFTKRYDKLGGRVGTAQEIKRVFSVAAAKYGKESACLLVESEFLYLADQRVEWLHGVHYRNWREFSRCKNEEEVFDWIFRDRKFACIIMTDSSTIPLLTSAKFRDMVRVEFSRMGYLLLVPKADTAEPSKGRAG